MNSITCCHNKLNVSKIKHNHKFITTVDKAVVSILSLFYIYRYTYIFVSAAMKMTMKISYFGNCFSLVLVAIEMNPQLFAWQQNLIHFFLSLSLLIHFLSLFPSLYISRMVDCFQGFIKAWLAKKILSGSVWAKSGLIMQPNGLLKYLISKYRCTEKYPCS